MEQLGCKAALSLVDLGGEKCWFSSLCLFVPFSRSFLNSLQFPLWAPFTKSSERRKARGSLLAHLDSNLLSFSRIFWSLYKEGRYHPDPFRLLPVHLTASHTLHKETSYFTLICKSAGSQSPCKCIHRMHVIGKRN